MCVYVNNICTTINAKHSQNTNQAHYVYSMNITITVKQTGKQQNTHTHTHKRTNKQTNKQRNTQTNKETNKQTNKLTYVIHTHAHHITPAPSLAVWCLRRRATRGVVPAAARRWALGLQAAAPRLCVRVSPRARVRAFCGNRAHGYPTLQT